MSSRLFHLLTRGSRMAVSLTCGPGQRLTLTGQWTIQVGPRLGRLGLNMGWALARHVARAGAAMSSYWANNGPWSTGAGEARFMVNPPVLVHRPQSRSMKDLVHLLLPRVRFTCTKCTDVWPARGKSPASSRRAPTDGELPSEPTRGVGVQFKVGKSLALPWRVPW